jgi:outer membrane protein TolC
MMAFRAIKQRSVLSRIDPLRSLTARSLRRAATHLCLAGALLAGCRGSPSADPVRQIGEATNVKDAIEFRSIGEPVDVAEAATDSLSLQQAIERTLRHDPELQMALAKARSALADAKQARLLPNPVLSVALRFPSGGTGKPVIEAGIAADLLSILQQPRRTSAADHRLRAASADAVTTALNIVAEVQERYVSAQALEAQVVVLSERLDLVKRLLDLAKSRMAAGEAARLDVLSLDTERVGIEANLIDRRAVLTDERLQLARLLGEPSSHADWKLAQWAAPPAAPIAESNWIAAALQHRPEVQSAEWELAALGEDVVLARSSALDGLQIGADAERDDRWTVGPAISTPLPLFDWGQERAAKAEADRVAARHRFTQVRRQVVEDVRRAIASLRSAQTALAKVRNELIPLQERRREQAEAQYRNGFADVTAVLMAEQDLKDARVQLIELQQKAALAEARLERAVGGSAVAAVERNIR